MSSCPWLTAQPIAHRGYHDMNSKVWENTLSAFSRAIDAGFAIECDLQYAADGVPVVFHDEDLQRLCNIAGRTRDKTSGELALLSVGGTKDRVPTLKQMLQLVNGRVPLVIELKDGGEDDEGFAASVLDTLDGYEGDVALMSFKSDFLREFRELGCERPIGLTAEGGRAETWEPHFATLDIGFDFISYQAMHLPNPFIDEARKRGIAVITWTVRDALARQKTKEFADQMTFEGFDPRTLDKEE
ncbi:glycerophosphodiester phosphodiesterase [Rhizobium sp. L1K21]|uniref:glycerophosphodiester phosphodiesterase n=1 Tax=Rhizobium sp. L1K21 TaxID=2954933 RepID=UPI0020937E4B|nr:glycerophosphodiester phosphodiesterase [Rhizobium sp. L1K21]MCO6185983.1 glycerophosphodiester phosphodiesterase [Rhizobium sp. L1K21]